MSKVDTKYVLARSLENGETYRIGVSLLKKYPFKWEILPEEGSEDVKDGVEEMDYFELKTRLSDLGVPFKGNASKADLIHLYRSAVA